MDNSVSQVTVAGTPGGDATVTAAQLVNLPAVGATRVNVVVSLTAQRNDDDADLHRAGDP